MLGGLHSFLQALGKNLLPRLFKLLAKFSSLNFSFPCCLLTGNCSELSEACFRSGLCGLTLEMENFWNRVPSHALNLLPRRPWFFLRAHQWVRTMKHHLLFLKSALVYSITQSWQWNDLHSQSQKCYRPLDSLESVMKILGILWRSITLLDSPWMSFNPVRVLRKL